MNIKESNLNAQFVFIKSPSLEELEQRLRSRNSESDESIQQRLNTAKQELAYAEKPGSYDKIIINDDLNKAFTELESFILSN